MQTVAIRRATPEDFDSIQELNHQLFLFDAPRDPYMNLKWPFEEAGLNYYRELVDGKEGTICIIAEVGGKVAGYLAGGKLAPRSTD